MATMGACSPEDCVSPTRRQEMSVAVTLARCVAVKVITMIESDQQSYCSIRGHRSILHGSRLALRTVAQTRQRGLRIATRGCSEGVAEVRVSRRAGRIGQADAAGRPGAVTRSACRTQTRHPSSSRREDGRDSEVQGHEFVAASTLDLCTFDGHDVAEIVTCPPGDLIELMLTATEHRGNPSCFGCNEREPDDRWTEGWARQHGRAVTTAQCSVPRHPSPWNQAPFDLPRRRLRTSVDSCFVPHFGDLQHVGGHRRCNPKVPA